MADLDTTSKRRSSVGILIPSTLAPPDPDGTIGQGDRQHIALSYSGILASAPPGGTGGAVFRSPLFHAAIFRAQVI